ncbi:MAG: hypothetical protein AAB834_00160 [Patescibacteria group bacterium]
MTIYIEARFTGASDLGYQHGHAYQLRLDQHWGGGITIIATHGYDFKPVSGMQRTYKGLAAFLHDWKTIRVLMPQITSS